jgi:hypothetical protein
VTTISEIDPKSLFDTLTPPAFVKTKIGHKGIDCSGTERHAA